MNEFDEPPDDEDDDDRYPTVPRVPPRCPRCKQDRSRMTGQSRDGVFKYHLCRCGKKFRSMEVDPPELAQKD